MTIIDRGSYKTHKAENLTELAQLIQEFPHLAERIRQTGRVDIAKPIEPLVAAYQPRRENHGEDRS